jgi:hypothetical protein
VFAELLQPANSGDHPGAPTADGPKGASCGARQVLRCDIEQDFDCGPGRGRLQRLRRWIERECALDQWLGNDLPQALSMRQNRLETARDCVYAPRLIGRQIHFVIDLP